MSSIITVNNINDLSWSSYVADVFPSEDILDDGVGLLLESSGDSLDDDSEIYDECRKVRGSFL